MASLPLEGSAEEVDPYELSLAQLGQLKVYTASRDFTSLEEAPAVMSVITAASIKAQGLKTLRDVLDRVPGFFNQWDRNFSLIAIRGYTQDPVNNVLLLVDGHNINSQAGEGIGNTHLLPLLYQVKQIEIIRAPGSTLWGGDAASGIINIITYDGAELAEKGEQIVRINLDYEFDMKRRVTNLLYGTQFDEGDLMISATYTESDGNSLPVYNVYTDDQVVVQERYRVRHDQHRPTYEVQAKGHWRDFSLNARLFEHKGYYRNVGPTIENEYRDYGFDFIELGYSPELAVDLTWETTIHINEIDEAFWRRQTDGSISIAWTQIYDELGLSSILTYHPEDYVLKAGLQLTDRDFDGRQLTAGSSGLIVPASISGDERNYGVFGDFTYRGIDDWRFIVGGRFQHDDLRQKGDYFLGRAAVIHKASKQWSIKYAYNTGIVGTTLNRSQSARDNYIVQDSGIIVLGPEEPQLTQSHDLQFSYTEDTVQANLGFFYQRLDNYISIGPLYNTGQLLDGHELWTREDNFGELHSKGIEFDWTWEFAERWSLYGNYSYALSKFDSLTGVTGQGRAYHIVEDGNSIAIPDRRLTGVPLHMWNVGLEFFPVEYCAINLHYRGWDDAWAVQVPNSTGGVPVFGRYGAEHFVDAAITFREAFGKDLELQLYARNLLNNSPVVPMTAHYGSTLANGAEYGVGFKYEF
ncbi:TonB-dependent receptor [Pelagicoccus sp. SDUM812003]|uniref:TonB-dependent receptor plug domain-containing protein n=1 Tax=Pelagicoccus sp. SDUM812003 TaxID=3041267 RepID=UPI00280CA704|nr:TonB-dependent receptor [Pelagicoccus sp. SDUM812003]MDQ8202157.1 TonB-dependent receptor [Pelagicoccus sp. SDUM812003]